MLVHNVDKHILLTWDFVSVRIIIIPEGHWNDLYIGFEYLRKTLNQWSDQLSLNGFHIGDSIKLKKKKWILLQLFIYCH